MVALRPQPPLSTNETVDRLYYRPSEVVKMTGLSKAAVFEALWSGDLKGYRVGKAWLIPVDALHEWVRGSGRTA
jgi:excisionase family DNA binding protein